MNLLAVATNSNVTKAMWYLTRATGVVSIVLLTASVVLGVVTSVRWVSARWPRFVTAGLHRNVSLLVVVFLAVHIVTAIADGFAPIGWKDTLVPFLSHYRPIWLGLGTVAFDLLLALVVSSLLRERIGYRAWRVLHWAAYACWPVALLHGLGTGSDTRQPLVLLVSLACLVAVVVALAWRVGAGWPAAAGVRLTAGVATVLVPMLIVGWLVKEPLRPGWARRAGTPTALLASSRAAVGSAAGTAGTGTGTGTGSTGSALIRAFDASMRGTISQSQPDPQGNTTVRIHSALSGGVTGTLDIAIAGQALNDGGVQMSTGSVTLAAANGSLALQGRITLLDGTRVRATVQDRAGRSESVDVRLAIGGDGTSVSGVVKGTPGTGGSL